MNSDLAFTPTRTRGSFAGLLKIGPNASESSVNAVVDAVMQDAREEPNPDATTTFNELLHLAGRFTLEMRPEFRGGEAEAEHAWCLGLVLSALAEQQVVLGDHGGKQVWGWESLSRDAQGWCWDLLWCREPVGFDAKAHRALAEAKALVGQLIPIPVTSPVVGRRPEGICRESEATDIKE